MDTIESQGIRTRALPETTTKGKRIAAMASSGAQFVQSWNSNKTIEENHIHAARVLCDRLGWDVATLTGGWFKDDGYFALRFER